MTKRWREYIRWTCRKCGHEQEESTEPPLSAWIREHPMLDAWSAGLSIHDIDYVVHKFEVKDHSTGRSLGQQLIMLLEYKKNNGKVSPSQRSTFQVLRDMLTFAHKKRVYFRHFKKGWGTVLFKGHHCVRFSGTRPDDSEWITWDNKPITEDQLLGLLRFELHAETLRPVVHRSHHKAHPALKESWLTT